MAVGGPYGDTPLPVEIPFHWKDLNGNMRRAKVDKIDSAQSVPGRTPDFSRFFVYSYDGAILSRSPEGTRCPRSIAVPRHGGLNTAMPHAIPGLESINNVKEPNTRQALP